MTRLLDTNVISELVRPSPDAAVLTYVAALEEPLLSVVTIQELEYGVARLASGSRKDTLERFLEGLVEQFADRILPVDEAVARSTAELRVARERLGRPLHLADALIAGTARVHGLILVTRNVADFAATGLTIENPWDGA